MHIPTQPASIQLLTSLKHIEGLLTLLRSRSDHEQGLPSIKHLYLSFTDGSVDSPGTGFRELYDLMTKEENEWRDYKENEREA